MEYMLDLTIWIALGSLKGNWNSRHSVPLQLLCEKLVYSEMLRFHIAFIERYARHHVYVLCN
jgi:hypothetical protein